MKNLIAVYGRLSKDEKGERYSSLEVQRDYVVQFIQDHQLGEIVDCFLDDDITGVLFQREELDRLLQAVELGWVNVIVIKDLSRLGRSNAKTLTLLEKLEEQQVRVIAIDDQWDSFRDNDDIIGIKTWYNERYVKDISKKIRSNIHQKLKAGEYLGTSPYGYRKEYQTVNGKLKPQNKLLVDEKLRSVIVEIFNLYLEGRGYQSIAAHLQKNGYPHPSQYKNYDRPQSTCWTKEHVKRIISNRVYCGDTVQGISERISYKSKKTRRKPAAAWYLTENTHEPIVSREQWQQANTIRQQKAGCQSNLAKPGRHLFSGLLVCGACGRKLVSRKKSNRPLGYVCSGYAAHGKKAQGCESHFIREDFLLELIWEHFCDTLEAEQLQISYQTYCSQLTERDDFSGRITALEKEIRQFTKHLELVYEDRLNQVLSVDFFQEKARQLEAKIAVLQAQVVALKQQQTDPNGSLVPLNEVRPEEILAMLRELRRQEGVTRQILTKLLDRIYVFLPGDISSTRLEPLQSELQTNPRTLESLKEEGGIFVIYRYLSKTNQI